MSTCFSCNQIIPDTVVVCAHCNVRLVLQGKYALTRLLGSGGFGAVYQAEQLALGKSPCAIKELLPEANATASQRQSASEQFRLEASILAQLSHPALPRVSDFFVEDGRQYLVMEYVEGETLEERLQRMNAPLAESQVKAWAETLCDVLTYLHTRQPNPVIHRDIKPANIKITPDNRLKLIDFGIAKLMGIHTQDAARAVSPPYSPMEQYGKGTDARSDVYALGVTLYQLITNHLPPEAPDLTSHQVVPPQQLNPTISTGLQIVILKAMANDPTQRYQTAIEMKRALSHPLEGTKKLPEPTPAPRRIPIIAGVAAIVILVLGLAFWQMNEANTRAQATATAFALATTQAQVASTATAQAQAQAALTATAAARAIEQAHATATSQADATAQAQARATTQAIATESARAQASATAQARAAATAQVQAQATTQAIAAEAARAQAQATAQAQAAATAQAIDAARRAAASIRNCPLTNSTYGTVRLDNWVGLDLSIILRRDNGEQLSATLLNEGRPCLTLPPGVYQWRVRAPANASLGEIIGSVAVAPGEDWVIPFCVANGKVSNNCQ